ncbi:MAG: AMP-binding protein [Betaproteobacteria bacterium]|nr:AMP-binding protein [Betaproteobacteria bacterium]
MNDEDCARRVFKNIQTIPALLDYAVDCHGDLPAIKNKDKDLVESISRRDLQKAAFGTASLFAQKGIHGKHIAIIGNPGRDWLILFLAVVSSGNIAVLIDKNLSETDIAQLMRQADVSHLILDSSLSQKAAYLKSVLDHNHEGMCFGEENNGEIDGFLHIRRYLDEALNETAYAPNITIHPDQDAVIVFTSGATGNSKAVLLSHKNICDKVCCILQITYDFTPGEHIISILPPHHILEVTAGLLAPLCYGGTICFGGGLKYLSRNIKFFQPVFMLIVPMVVEGFYKQILNEIRKKGKEKQMTRAIRLSNFLRLLKIDLRRRLFKDIHDSFGGKIHAIFCGGAFLDPELVKRFDEWGLPLCDGYGITECTAAVSCNLSERHKTGSVGTPFLSPFCEVKIVDGEIFVRGSIVMKGYYKDEEATQQVFSDGWFKTGDLGYIDADGFLFITGRKKNVIILSDGNNVSPEELETLLEKLPLVKSVFVCVKEHHNLPMITACVHPDFEYAREHGIGDIQAELERETTQINISLPFYKRVQKIEISEDDFEKTPLGKVKRHKYNTALPTSGTHIKER